MKKLIVLLLLILLVPVAQAGYRSLGSVLQSEPHITIYKGRAGEFRMLFFNLGDKTVYLKLEIEGAPKTWKTTVYSPKLTGSYIRLDPVKPTPNPKPSLYSSWVYFNDTYVIEATPVTLNIHVPHGAGGGVFPVKVSAFTMPVSTSNQQGIKQLMSLGREFEFRVTVPGSPEPIKPENKPNETINISQYFNQTKQTPAEQQSVNIFGNNPALNITPKQKTIPYNKTAKTLDVNSYLTGLATGKPESVTPTFLLLIFSFLGGYLMYRKA